MCDSDGTVARNGKTQSIQIGSTEHEFLLEVQLMLQTTGVSSKVTLAREEGTSMMPLNDGSGELGEFNTRANYRLLIGQTGVNTLQDLGFVTHRLKLTDHRPNRECNHFVRIASVVDEGRISDTYCFKEKKRGMAVFNGILTGQCAEITLPTTPLMHIDDDKGEIALCTLAAFNLGNPTLFEDLPELSDLIVRALDSLLDYQDYPVKAAEKNKLRRTLGVGVVNTAYYIAKNGKKYSDGSANNLVHELFESIQYNLLKASCGVAKEQGACEWFHKTKYAQGIMPVDNYKKEVDNYHSAELLCDWSSLREDILKYGLRNSTLTALMPSETSSQISNATNGIEPPRALSTTKASKDSYFKQVVPDVLDLWLDYELIWDMPDNKGYLTLCGIMQKFVDQSISANTNYDPNKFKDRKVPLQLILEDLYLSYRLGVKTLYYHNTRDGSGEDLAEDDGCESGACKI
jgi:ribonucleotide reductase alpha subunit